MACYAYSVLTQWFCSVYSGAGSEPSLNQMAKQVVIASSATPKDVNDALLTQEPTYDIPDVVQLTDRKGGDTSKVIIIPVEAANFITGKAHCAYVTTRSEEDLEDCLICDGGATCILTKGRRNSDSAWNYLDALYSPMLQSVLCSLGRVQSNDPRHY
jgi:hypothetical protein